MVVCSTFGQPWVDQSFWHVYLSPAYIYYCIKHVGPSNLWARFESLSRFSDLHAHGRSLKLYPADHPVALSHIFTTSFCGLNSELRPASSDSDNSLDWTARRESWRLPDTGELGADTLCFKRFEDMAEQVDWRLTCSDRHMS